MQIAISITKKIQTLDKVDTNSCKRVLLPNTFSFKFDIFIMKQGNKGPKPIMQNVALKSFETM